MANIWDILTFKKMLSPILLQILFWGGVGGTLYGAIWLLMRGNWAGWMALIFGLVGVRFIFEIAILAFRNYEALSEIRSLLKINKQVSEE